MCAFAVAVALLGARKKGPDLFDLTARVSDVDGYRMVAWHELEREHRALKRRGLSPGAATRVLGYMMTGAQQVREGQFVGCFVLLPDPGSPIHPAHRFGDQMIEVRLRAGDTVPFSEGDLVWVTGMWTILPGDPNGPVPLYALANAEVRPANKSDISKYFR
jgi:hypothetical protein